MRNLIVILGDQLDVTAAVWNNADPAKDAVWMAETMSESTYVWSSKVRTAFFLAAMRHFRDALRASGWTVHYTELAQADGQDLQQLLQQFIERHQPQGLLATEPGEYRMEGLLRSVSDATQCPLTCLADRHFFCSKAAFARHAKGRKQLRMEFFYREMRTEHRILLDADGQPVGGQWNYDADNRRSFGRSGPPQIPQPPPIECDPITRAVINTVNEHLGDHPGCLDDFNWPVTRAQALQWLDHFIAHALPHFGDYQDAMWQDEPFLFHSRLSAALNVKLLAPREVVAAAVAAWQRGDAPLNAVEGFIRQILGWREYVRGIYWLHMPEYIERNALDAQQSLPGFYWSGDTEYACLRAAIKQTLQHGYAHHIQRLMVTGLYALLLGVQPQQVHAWYLAVYVDAVEWVELPNTLGMSQYADGGIMASKPYIASGKYIQRMSNYCQSCPKRPDHATGPHACPFTTLYWNFLITHKERLAKNPRMALQVRNLQRLFPSEQQNIQSAAKQLITGD